MKGSQESVTNTLIKVILMFVVILIVIIVAYVIIKYWIPQSSLKAKIAQLCPEWRQNQCSELSAEELQVTVGTTNKTLVDLCMDEYSQFNPTSFSDIYERCKKDCIGCP